MKILTMLTGTINRIGVFMNKKIIIWLLIGCLLLFVTVWTFAQSSPRVRWEYTILDTNANINAFNNLGQEG